MPPARAAEHPLSHCQQVLSPSLWSHIQQGGDPRTTQTQLPQQERALTPALGSLPFALQQAARKNEPLASNAPALAQHHSRARCFPRHKEQQPEAPGKLPARGHNPPGRVYGLRHLGCLISSLSYKSPPIVEGQRLSRGETCLAAALHCLKRGRVWGWALPLAHPQISPNLPFPARSSSGC